MKMTAQSYARLENALGQMAQRKSWAERRATIVAEGRAKDVDKRTRWDMLWEAQAAGLFAQPAGITGSWLCNTLYNDEDLNDDHIDTALRRIVASL